MRRIIPFALSVTKLLTGCSMPQVTEYETRESRDYSAVNQAKSKENNRNTAKEASMSYDEDDFLSNRINMNEFDEQKYRVQHGVQIAQEQAELGKEEQKLWEKLMAEEKSKMSTSDDLEAKEREFCEALDELAAKGSQTLGEMLKNAEIKMSEKEAYEFIKEQAKKFVESDAEVRKAMEEAEAEKQSAENQEIPDNFSDFSLSESEETYPVNTPPVIPETMPNQTKNVQ